MNGSQNSCQEMQTDGQGHYEIRISASSAGRLADELQNSGHSGRVPPVPFLRNLGARLVARSEDFAAFSFPENNGVCTYRYQSGATGTLVPSECSSLKRRIGFQFAKLLDVSRAQSLGVTENRFSAFRFFYVRTNFGAFWDDDTTAEIWPLLIEDAVQASDAEFRALNALEASLRKDRLRPRLAYTFNTGEAPSEDDGYFVWTGETISAGRPVEIGIEKNFTSMVHFSSRVSEQDGVALANAGESLTKLLVFQSVSARDQDASDPTHPTTVLNPDQFFKTPVVQAFEAANDEYTAIEIVDPTSAKLRAATAYQSMLATGFTPIQLDAAVSATLGGGATYGDVADLAGFGVGMD